MSLFLCLVMLPASALCGAYSGIAQEIVDNFEAKRPCPLACQKVGNITVDQAYEIQAEVVQLMVNKGEVIMGYKAGLFSPKGQKRFGLKEPIYGTLFKSMLRWPGTLYLKNHVRMFIEPEIGFRFGKDITNPVQDIMTLKRAVSITFPAIELPDLGFSNMKLLRGTDVIAANAGARKVLIGKATRSKDLNAVKIKYLHNGKEIATGMGKNAGGDQWKALKWVVNNVLAKGGEVKEGYIVITGCLTKLLPAKEGTYLVDYGDFGRIEFECR